MALQLKWTASVIIVMVFVYMADGMDRVLGKMKASKEICVSQQWDIHSFRRGQFKFHQKPTESLESLNQFDMKVISAAIGKEVQCNDAYYMLSYLHLTVPRYFSYPIYFETLHSVVNDNYPDWARKILATAFNVAQNDSEMDVSWLFFLYVKRIEAHLIKAKDPNEVFLPVLKTAHYGMYKVLLCKMFENDCTMFNPETNEERKFTAYVAALDWSKDTYSGFSGNIDAVLKLLKMHWPDLRENSIMGRHQKETGTSSSVPSVQPLNENHLTTDLLYLNDVFNNAKGTTLLTEFGVFEDGDRLLRYLKNRILEMKSGSTSFQHYVLALVDFHEHVQGALKTMMLRIYYEFLEMLKTLNKNLREEHVKQFLITYNDWCDFLHLSRFDNGFYVRDLQRSWNIEDSVSERIVPGIQKWVINSLSDIDKASNIPLFNHESLNKIDIDKSWIMMTAKEYEFPLDARFRALKDLPNKHIQTTILCAEVFVEYLKNIFSHINFKAIHSLVKLKKSTNVKRFQEYVENYQETVFSQERETRTIKVCGTETIQFYNV